MYRGFTASVSVHWVSWSPRLAQNTEPAPVSKKLGCCLECCDGSFYEGLLSLSRVEDTADYVVLKSTTGPETLTFQRIVGFRSPQRRDPDRPAQMHVDVIVEDLDPAEAKVLALGAMLVGVIVRCCHLQVVTGSSRSRRIGQGGASAGPNQTRMSTPVRTGSRG
ncbi:VOC family protein [Streptomyces sp. NPDC001709]